MRTYRIAVIALTLAAASPPSVASGGSRAGSDADNPRSPGIVATPTPPAQPSSRPSPLEAASAGDRRPSEAAWTLGRAEPTPVPPAEPLPGSSPGVGFVKTSADEYELTVRPGEPTFVFRLLTKEGGAPDRLELRRKGDPTLVQTFDMSDLDAELLPYALGADDFDFDGNLDLKILAWAGVTGNEGFGVYLFEPAAGRFVLHDDLSELTNPTPDRRTKTISEHGTMGGAGMLYSAATYIWENGRLVKITWETQGESATGDGYVCERGVRRDGRWVETRQEGAC